MTKKINSLTEKIPKFINYAKENGIPHALYSTLQPLGLVPTVHFMNWKNSRRFGDPRIYLTCDIYQLLPKSTELTHPIGIVIHQNADLGEHMNIYHNTTIGASDGGTPTIEDNVDIMAGAAVIGDVLVGKNSIIGANSTVTSDIPPNSVAAGSPAKVIQKRNVGEES